MSAELSGFSPRAGLGPEPEIALPKPESRSREARLMPSTHKKVIVRKMDRDSVSGYVSPSQFITEGKLELLNTAGTVIAIDLREIKGVYFVREFGDSESLTRKTFTSRPRSEGLWVRLRFKDNEILEGLMPSDLTQNLPEGYLVNPPDQRSNTQRIFVPRTALESLTVLAVIGATRAPQDAAPPKTNARSPCLKNEILGIAIFSGLR